ncbi:MAG: hypothetical protein J6I73_09270 [Treponema sp.]|nr:hypothetical protein [Treponema sp.]
MRLFSKAVCALLMASVVQFPVAAQTALAADTTPEPYGEDEFPQFMKDLRRAEIISFGALPFVTLTSTLVYSGIRWGKHGFDTNYFPNPFAKSSDANGFSQQEQIGILLTSVGISVGIGLTDLIVNVVKRKVAKKKRLREEAERAPVIITPINEDENAVKIALPEKKDDAAHESGATHDDSAHGDDMLRENDVTQETDAGQEQHDGKAAARESGTAVGE